MEVLARDEWSARAQRHRERLAPVVEAHLARQDAHVAHPVHDFLFRYYSQRPAQLLRWHPGYAVGLAEAPDHARLKGYTQADGPAGPVAHVDPAYVVSQRVLLTTLHRLLRATAARPAHTGCFGLHEWAMVHRLGQDETRHPAWPLRLGPAGTDAVVEGHRIACTHFDAYRFFTPTARPLNTLSPGRDDRADFEQPGCLHAGMDLYKHAFRLSPMVPSDLVADCFELARDIRVLDMRASPYDFADLDDGVFAPVRIETPAGKRAYAAAQADFAERGQVQRARLIEECERLLPVASDDGLTGRRQHRRARPTRRARTPRA